MEVVRKKQSEAGKKFHNGSSKGRLSNEKQPLARNSALEKASKVTGISPSKAYKVKAIKEKGIAELQDKARNEEISINRASVIAFINVKPTAETLPMRRL